MVVRTVRFRRISLRWARSEKSDYLVGCVELPVRYVDYVKLLKLFVGVFCVRL